MLYSIGKDSSVLLRLAQKAFYPGPIPFPLLHIDTTYKFREMIEFRDRYTAEIGARLIVHTNTEAIAEGTQPFWSARKACCGALKTKSLLDALAPAATTRRSAARGATRSGRAPRSGSSRCATPTASGIRRTSGRSCGGCSTAGCAGREHPRLPAVELDRDRRLELHPPREHPGRAALLRQGARGRRPRRVADPPRAAVRAAAAGRAAPAHHVPHAVARLLAVHRRDPLGRPTPCRRSSRS